MYKRTKIGILLSMALVAVLMLFATTGVMAKDCEPQLTCGLVTISKSGAISSTPYSITFTGKTEVSGKWVWQYRLSDKITTNQLIVLSPVCCPDIGALNGDGGQTIPPGSGDPTTGYGQGIFQYYAIRLAASDPTTYWFSTTADAPALRNTSMQLKSGSTLYYCPSIVGPSCAEWAQDAVTTDKTVTATDGTEFVVQVDPVTQCEVAILCGNTSCQEIALNELLYIGNPDEPGSSIVTAVSTPGSGCPTVVIRDESENSTYYCSGGRCYYR